MSLGSGVIPAWLIDTEIDRQLAQTRGNYKEAVMAEDLEHELELEGDARDYHRDVLGLGSDQDAPGEFIQLDDDIENEADVDEY